MSVVRVSTRINLVIRDMLNKFHLRYTAVVMELRDWHPLVFEIWKPLGGPLVTAYL